MKNTLIAFSLSLILLVLLKDANAAEISSTVLPYESWLSQIQQSLTGPVARSVALIGIVSSGMTLIFAGGEINRFIKSLVYLVLVMGMILGANSIMSSVFNGSVVANNEGNFNKGLYEDNKTLQQTISSFSKQSKVNSSLFIDYSKLDKHKADRMC